MSLVDSRGRASRLRQALQSVFDEAGTGHRHATLLQYVLVFLILVSVTSIVLQTVPELAAAYGLWFGLVEDVAVAVFVAEYVLRVWCAPDQAVYAGRGPWTARLQFIRTGPAIIDLLSVAPAVVGVLVAADLKIFLLLRLMRFFKLARYSPGMRSLAFVLQVERRALLASAVILLGFVILSASAMYSVEHDTQPDKFGSIPAAMWWAIVTLTTVGYGDVYPVTALGRVVASVTMVFGLMMLALPVGIVATAFADEIHRREFVITWGMIAKIPLFETLSASEIGEITRFLNARTVPKGTAIVRQGEDALQMFLIASGQVEVELPTGSVKLGEGQFFGEQALLEKTKRSATVRAAEATKLLVLDAGDLQSLMDRNQDVGRRIRSVAQKRQEANDRLREES